MVEAVTVRPARNLPC